MAQRTTFGGSYLTFKEIIMFNVKKTTAVMGDVFQHMDKTLDQMSTELDKVFDSDFFKSTKETINSILSYAGTFPSFPPVNVYTEKFNVDPTTLEQLKDPILEYVVQLALSGYKSEDVEVNVHDVNGVKFLVIESKGHNDKRDNIKWFQHGIAGRAFKMSFTIANNVKVKSANLENGLLSIHLTVENPIKKPAVENIPVNKG